MNNRIRHIRELNGLSLEDLARAAGTTNQQVSLLETGKRRLTVEWLFKLAGALDCHPWSLVEERQVPGLVDAESQLLKLFESLRPQQQRTLLKFLGVMVSPPSV
ncbi:helix-turn-helix transcriptional regulator [Dyella marensis]|uniref:helix-turn-helix domain-containing protein n=1 Tax=Dyella TaxID=231454 RepID=UPI00344D00BA